MDANELNRLLKALNQKGEEEFENGLGRDLPSLDATLVFKENGLPMWWAGNHDQLLRYLQGNLPEHPNEQDLVDQLREALWLIRVGSLKPTSL